VLLKRPVGVAVYQRSTVKQLANLLDDEDSITVVLQHDWNGAIIGLGEPWVP
jgi:hypothetical protein